MPGWTRTMPATTDESPVSTVEPEAEIVARAKLDRKAFEPLYTRYLDPVYRYCYGKLGSQEAAEDATSQVFIKAMAALQSYHEGSFRGWLFTIAHNVIVDAYRHQHSNEPIDEASDLADEAPTPEEFTLAAEEIRSVRTLLAKLPPEQRSVVELRLASLSGAEIAEALGRTTGAVKMLQFRAMTRLRALLGTESGVEGGYGEAHDGR